jgi:hypothetical protein
MSRRWFGILAIVLILSVGTISCSYVSDFIDKIFPRFLGISSDAPLGTLDKYEEHLSKNRFTSEGFNQGENFLGDGYAYIFTVWVHELEDNLPSNFQSKVVVIADDEDYVLAVGALTSDQTVDKAKVFMKELWIKVYGHKPIMSDVITPAAHNQPAVLGAKNSNRDVVGQWGLLTEVAMERIRLVLSDYEYDD